jgi:hypothetical protein
MFGHFVPFWNIEDIKQLPFKNDYHKDLDLVNRYVSVGHSKDHIKLWNFFDTDAVIPEMTNNVRSLFPELTNISVAVNKFTPGQYLPLHQDLYGRYRKIHKLDDHKHIRRIIIMIEDSCPGQISQVGNTTWGNWRAGDWFDWLDGFPHAAYNFSMLDRYAWQVTGVVR